MKQVDFSFLFVFDRTRNIFIVNSNKVINKTNTERNQQTDKNTIFQNFGPPFRIRYFEFSNSVIIISIQRPQKSQGTHFGYFGIQDSEKINLFFLKVRINVSYTLVARLFSARISVIHIESVNYRQF
jgi:hypothetical protein